jgi:hypothetical protein
MEHVVGFTHTYDAIRTLKTLSGHCLLVQSPDVGGVGGGVQHPHSSVSHLSKVFRQFTPSQRNVFLVGKTRIEIQRNNKENITRSGTCIGNIRKQGNKLCLEKIFNPSLTLEAW